MEKLENFVYKRMSLYPLHDEEDLDCMNKILEALNGLSIDTARSVLKKSEEALGLSKFDYS